MKKLKVSEKKALWEALVIKHYNHEFPKLYRAKFDKTGFVRNAAWHYALTHFPTLVRMFDVEVRRQKKRKEDK